VKVAEAAHLAQVVVPAREMEQEVTDGVEAQSPARTPQDVGGGEAREAERLAEELDGIARDRGGDRRLERPAALRRPLRSARRPVAHSAEIRYR
jgi:hypothetical protein